MKRFDLRHLHNDFYARMGELINTELAQGEVGIFLFEIDDFSNVAKSAEFVSSKGYEVMNSVRFNHRDWTLVVRKSPPKLESTLQKESQSPTQESAKAGDE
ncbi:NADH-ubiquinone oxidoreductase subunit E family protein [Helicobacter canis]|uniref:Uncharacterized protein n=1 Tax=Helicobacter canis TaxID=29419 RepID=A0A5M9QI15_9HELI|nr:NADH-ubiquinone oxidoreductase subunit E family protein [Helicobacter canis]KAA8707881.1 hypothetical protein F4V45_08460 [Helicobacter canis]